MAIDLSNISMPMAALLASLIGAAATMTASFMNLRLAWKKEVLAARTNQKAAKKSGRGPLIPLLTLLIASAVGGFALSYYLGNKGRANIAALEAELRTKIEQLNVSAQRLEKVSLNGTDAIAQQVRDEERRKRGMEGVGATVVLEKCVTTSADGQTACDESTAHPVRLCTEIPADASVTAVDLYARPEGDARPWTESRVAAGNDFGGGRFASQPTERLISGSAKQVCQELRHWNSGQAINGRMVVHYGPGQLTVLRPATSEQLLAPEDRSRPAVLKTTPLTVP